MPCCRIIKREEPDDLAFQTNMIVKQEEYTSEDSQSFILK